MLVLNLYEIDEAMVEQLRSSEDPAELAWEVAEEDDGETTDFDKQWMDAKEIFADEPAVTRAFGVDPLDEDEQVFVFSPQEVTQLAEELAAVDVHKREAERMDRASEDTEEDDLLEAIEVVDGLTTFFQDAAASNSGVLLLYG